MSELVTQEDWQALMDVLTSTIPLLNGKEVEPVKLGILEFYSTAAMLGLEDLADTSKRFEEFLLQTVAPDWNEEAVATLSFAMGALIEKMQLKPYGPDFSAGLGEIVLYMDFFGEEGKSLPQPVAEESSPSDADSFGIRTVEIVLAPPADEDTAQAASPSDVATDENDPFGLGSLLAELENESPCSQSEVDDVLSDLFPSDYDGLSDLRSPGEGTSLEPDKAISAESVASFALEQEEAASPEPFDDLADDEPLPSISYTLEGEAEGEAFGYVMDTVEWYREVLKNDPTSQVFGDLAEELCYRELWEDAVDTCRDGLHVYPRHLKGRVVLGWALWQLGEFDEAEEILTEARADLESNAILYKVLAQIAEVREQSEEASSLLETFQRLDRGFGRPVTFEKPRRRARRRRRIEREYEPEYDMVEEEPSPPRRAAVARTAVKEPPLIGLLSGLLKSFEKKPHLAVELNALFSSSDRKNLAAMLETSL